MKNKTTKPDEQSVQPEDIPQNWLLSAGCPRLKLLDQLFILISGWRPEPGRFHLRFELFLNVSSNPDPPPTDRRAVAIAQRLLPALTRVLRSDPDVRTAYIEAHPYKCEAKAT